MPAEPLTDHEIAEVRAEARLMGVHPGDAKLFSRLLATIDHERAQCAVMREVLEAIRDNPQDHYCADPSRWPVERAKVALASDASSHLLARMRALEAVAEQARGMLIGLEHKEQTNPHDGMWLSYRTWLTKALAALDKVPR
jgi:hypothetical protein